MRYYVGAPREVCKDWEWDAIDDGSAAGGSLSLPLPYVATSKSEVLDMVQHLDDAAIGVIEIKIDDLAGWLHDGMPRTVTVRWLGTISSLVRQSAIAAGLIVNTGRIPPTGE